MVVSVAQFLPLKLVYEGEQQAETVGDNGAVPPVSMQPEFTQECSRRVSTT